MKFIISAISFLLLGLTSFSQDCKGLIQNKKDEFTGEQIKTSNTLVFKKGSYEKAFFQIDKISDSLILTFIYNNSDRRFANAGIFSCTKGDKIFLLLEDTTVLKLDLIGQQYSSRSESAGVGTEILLGRYAGFSKSNKVIFESEYKLSLSDLHILKSKKILKIRVEASGAKGDTGQKLKNIELAILVKEAMQLQKDIGCILE